MIKSIDEIRRTFLSFFQRKGHQIVPSSSLVPNHDPSLLFTNAGMNQFKNVFLGLEKRHYSRATTSQRCVRIGGKHNDLKHVGYTECHHTFFEMLGNFSFGDYFKYEAINYAWELLTCKDQFNLPKEKILVSVYANDDETYEIWEKKIGIPREKIIRIGDTQGVSYESDNFWKMDDIGPCGPCTEIFYDHGSNNYISEKFPEDFRKNNKRYIEIWNIVFIQFNRKIDGTMDLLKNPSIDTGMGLERIASVLQYVNSNYDIDLFRTLIKDIAQITNTTDLNNKSLRVIADHIRSCVFLINDGVVPSNENRGYALRRIIRRAIRHGYMLGVNDIFFYKLVSPLIKVMGEIGQELTYQKEWIEQILKTEENQFLHTMKRGLMILEEKLSMLQGNILSGQTLFLLYDTYGFPIDLTEDICRERNIKIDKVGFQVEMQKQQYRSSQSNFFRPKNNQINQINNISEFVGYSHLQLNCSIIGIFIDGKSVNNIDMGQTAVIYLNKTPFYPESGGQIGDNGKLQGNNFIFIVTDTKKYGQTIAHVGKLILGHLKLGDDVLAIINTERRMQICMNHSAAHLMHAALRKIIGISVVQKGSFINEKMLRFDFSYCTAMKRTEIHEVEDLVNEKIRCNLPVKTEIMNLESAKSKGVIALFDEKYEKYVRVLNIGNFSHELCGGTHVSYTGEIGLFFIISEFSIASGIRRIEAVTGAEAIRILHDKCDHLHKISQLFNNKSYNISDQVRDMFLHMRQLKKDFQKLKQQMAIKESIDLSSKAITIKKVKLIISEFKELDPTILRMIIDHLKTPLNSMTIVLSTVFNKKIFIIAGVSKNITNVIHAVELINMVAHQVGCKGGGNADIAKAGGGTDISRLPIALNSIEKWVRKKLSQQ